MSSSNLPSNTDCNSLASLKTAGNIMSARDLIFSKEQNQILKKLQCASRSNPNHYIIIIDLSYNSSINCENIEQLVNDFLEELILLHCREDGVKDYSRISVIIHKNEIAQYLFENGFVFISELRKHIIHSDITEKNKLMPWGEIKVKQIANYWIKEEYEGKPNIIQALNLAYDLIKEANTNYPNSMPPLLVNICEKTNVNFQNLEEKINTIKNQYNNIGNAMFSWFVFNPNNKQLNTFKKLTSYVPMIDEFRNIKDNPKLHFICSNNIPHIANIGSELYGNETIIDNPENIIKI